MAGSRGRGVGSWPGAWAKGLRSRGGQGEGWPGQGRGRKQRRRGAESILPGGFAGGPLSPRKRLAWLETAGMEQLEQARRVGLSPAPCPQARLHRTGVPGAGAARPAGMTSASRVPHLGRTSQCLCLSMVPRNLAGGSPETHEGGGCMQDRCHELQGTGAITAEQICPARNSYRCTVTWRPVSAAAICSMGIIPRGRGPKCPSGCCSCCRRPPSFPSSQVAPHLPISGDAQGFQPWETRLSSGWALIHPPKTEPGSRGSSVHGCPPHTGPVTRRDTNGIHIGTQRSSAAQSPALPHS